MPVHRLPLLVGFLAIRAGSLAAQDSVPPVVRDSVRPRVVEAAPLQPDTAAIPLGARPVSPGGALWRSLLLPGWGQAKLDRRVPAVLFVAFEGVALGMALRANAEYQQAVDANKPNRATAKATQREDWLVLLGVNHLIAGVEAYVAAHLWDFPGDVGLRALPEGVGAGISLPVRLP